MSARALRPGAPPRRRWALSLALVLGMVLPACGSVGKGGGDCLPAGTAEVCLSGGSPAKLSAKGLQPGSQVIAAETNAAGKAPPQIPPGTVGPDGTFPSDGEAISLAGSPGPVTILVTVTPRGGKPTTVTFQRK